MLWGMHKNQMGQLRNLLKYCQTNEILYQFDWFKEPTKQYLLFAVKASTANENSYNVNF